MSKFFKHLIGSHSMFTKLMASFILIIILMSSIHLVTGYIFVDNIEQEISKNISGQLANTVKEYEQYFDLVKNKMLLDFYIEYADALKAPKGHDYQNALILKDLSKYRVIYPYIEDFVIYIRNFAYVITMNGTLEKSSFFDKFCVSDFYTENFWLAEMDQNYMFQIYPLREFNLGDAMKSTEARQLMPVAMKRFSGSDFIIIVYIDLARFSRSLDSGFLRDLCLFDAQGTLLYAGSGEDSPAAAINLAGTPENGQIGYQKVPNGYLFTCRSPASMIIYQKFYPDTLIRDQIGKSNRLITLITLLAILASGLLSLYMVRRFSNPVKQLYALIRGNREDAGPRRDVANLQNVNERVLAVVKENSLYARDIKEKNSMLKNYYWQTRLMNIMLNPGESSRNLSIFSQFAVAIFRIHYRDAYYQQISRGKDAETYIIKDLVQIYVSDEFNDSVTFQTDARQIVSIVAVGPASESIEAAMTAIAAKLASEDEYIYFTIAYSDVYQNSAVLHDVYAKVGRILRYRKIAEATQILSEKILTSQLERFYFNKEQQQQLINLLQSSRKEDCLQLLDNLFDYNLKRETNEFCIYLLYVKIMDCCCEALLQAYTPSKDALPLTNICFNLEPGESVAEYRNRCAIAVAESISCIGANRTESDYIIGFVKKYIEGHYAEDISVDLLADKLKISRTYLSRHFKDITGMNLSDYLNMFCVRKACDLLENSMLMIKDIAPQVGINSISTFTRLFKNYTGLTPNDYRKRKIE